MSIQLKIKIKSLAAEARFIRIEELKARKMARANAAHQQPKESQVASDFRHSLHTHRTQVVRPEARSSQLAYGFLRGRKYSQLESSVRPDNPPNLKAITSMVERFGGDAAADKVKEWLNA